MPDEKKPLRDRMIAVIIGLVMVTGMGGFALMSMAPPQDTGPQFSVPAIVTYELSSDEIIYVLQTGRVLIEYFYTLNSTDYIDELPLLESFANQFSGFVVLEEVSSNSTRFEMIGLGGQIFDMNDIVLTPNNLLDTFCDMAIAQPAECLL
jgi:hypothetical protein